MSAVGKCNCMVVFLTMVILATSLPVQNDIRKCSSWTRYR